MAKRIFLVMATAFFAIAMVASWWSGLWAAIGITVTALLLGALCVFLMFKNPRWWLVLVCFLLAINLLQLSFFAVNSKQVIPELSVNEEQSDEVAMNETTEETEQQEETNSEAVLNDQEAESTNQEEEPTTDKKVESTPADTKIEQPTTSSDEENVKVVEKVVEVVKVVEVEKKVEVPKVVEVEKVVEVPKVVEVEKIVEVPKVVEVEKAVEVPKETITTSNPASTPTVPNYSYNPYGDPNGYSGNGYYGSNYDFYGDPTSCYTGNNYTSGSYYGSGYDPYGDPNW